MRVHMAKNPVKRDTTAKNRAMIRKGKMNREVRK